MNSRVCEEAMDYLAERRGEEDGFVGVAVDRWGDLRLRASCVVFECVVQSVV